MNTNVPAPLDGEEKESVWERLEERISQGMGDLLLQYGADSSEVEMGPKIDAIMIIIGALSSGLEGGVGALRGLDILDIGCGSVETAKEERSCEPSEPRHFEPWMARFLQSVGARIVGIDIGDLSKERFKGYSIDLSKSNALNFLPSSSFDIVHMGSLLDKDAPSPMLTRIMALNQNMRRWDPTCMDMTEMDVEIRKQALRLLREGGVFIYNRKAYKKVGGVFIEHLTGME